MAFLPGFLFHGAMAMSIYHPMTKRILILETDDHFAARLAQKLQQIDGFKTMLTASAREASLAVIQQRYDVAFLPVSEDAGTMRALRTLQSDIRIILTTPTSHVKIPEAYIGQIQGVLIKPLLEIDLATVLTQALDKPVPVVKKQQSLPANGVDTEIIVALFQQAKLGQLVQTAIFSHNGRLLAHWGEMNGTEAATVALQVSEGQDDISPVTQIQFMHLPARTGELLLYTRQVADDYLLTLVALPETPLSELRIRGRTLADSLADVVQGKLTAVSEATRIQTGLLGYRQSYAIVWRPIRPLPASLHIPLRRSMERLATANACVLTYISVQSELIHLVVLCPCNKDSVWAAYLFKNGSEKIIQQQYGISASLWDSGYYATESAVPLAEAELNLFLEA